MGEQMSRPSPQITTGQVTDADLREAMMGSNGNPTYEQQYGVTATPTGETPFGHQPSLAELELAAEIAKTRATNPMAFAEAQAQPNFSPGTDVEALAREAAEYRKKYGDSENEKGELRRRMAELEETFTGLMTQYQALQTAPQPQAWTPQPSPQFQQPYQPVQDPFAGLSDDDVVQGKNVKQLAGLFGSALYTLEQQNRANLERQAQLERQLSAQAKAASGITPMEEFRLTAKNPWLTNLPEANKIAAMQAIKKTEALMTPQHQFQQEAQAQTVAAQDRILRPLTHIEGARPAVSDNTQAALEAAYERDKAMVLALPIDPDSVVKGQMYRAQGLRWLDQKYKMGFAKPPSDLAR